MSTVPLNRYFNCYKLFLFTIFTVNNRLIIYYKDSMLMSHVSTLISTYESTDMIIATGGVKSQVEEDPLQNPKNIAILKVIL